MILFPKQCWSIARATSRLNIWEGSVRSGKTVSVNFKYLKSIGESMSGLPPDTIDVMVGKTLGSLKRNIINPICLLLGDDAQYFSGKQEFHIWDRVIHTIGANDERAVGKIQGATIRKALGDELTLWPESFFKMLDSRLSLDQSELLGTTNPGPPNHFLKKDYLDRKGELDLSSFHFKLRDNVRLSKKFIEAIEKNYVGLWYKRFILGLWCVAVGAIYDFFEEKYPYVIKICPTPKFKVVGIDYGTGNPTTFGLYGVNLKKKPRIWLEREYYYDSKKEQKQKSDDEYADDLIDFVDGETVLYTIIDPSALSFKVALRDKKYKSVLVDADNTVVDGIRTLSTMWKNGEYSIHRSNKASINETYGYIWDEKAQERGEDKPCKKDDHTRDRDRYVVQTLFGNNKMLDYSQLAIM